MSILDSIYGAAQGAVNYVSSAVSNLGSAASSAASNVVSGAQSAVGSAAQAISGGAGAVYSGGSSLVGGGISAATQIPSAVASFVPTQVSTPISFVSSPLSSISDMGAQANPVSFIASETPSIVKTGISTVGLLAPAMAVPALVGSTLVSSLPPPTYKTAGQWAEQLLGPGGGAAYAKATDMYTGKQIISSEVARSSTAGSKGSGADWTALLIPTYDTSTLPKGTSERSDYYGATQAGDTKTQAIATELASKPYLVNTIQPYKSYSEAVGVALEKQRETTTGKAQSYYGNELQKLIESNVGTSSEYHYQAAKSGVPQAANPYEYLGDLSVEFLKGSPTKSSEVFSPVSGELKSYLPVSGGLQQWAWNRAEGKNENVSYMPALAYLASAEGLEGPYGALYGGTGAEYVKPGEVSERLAAWSGMPRSASVTTIMPIQIGAAEPMTVSKTEGKTSSVLVPSSFDLWASNLNIPILSGAAVATSDFLLSGTNPIASMAKQASSLATGKDQFSRYMATTTEGTPVLSSSLTTVGVPTTTVRQLADGSYETVTTTPSTTTEGYSTPISTTYTPVMGGYETISKNYGNLISGALPSSVKEWYNAPTKTSGNLFVSGETGAFGIGTDYTNAFLKGAVKDLVEDPLTSIMNVGIGAALAATGEGLASYGTKVVGATEGMGALSTVAKGTNWFINKGAPVVLGGLYAADVAGRSTSWGKDLTPAAAQKFGGIFSTETGPMVLGGMAWANRGAIKEALPSTEYIKTSVSDVVSPTMKSIKNFDILNVADVARSELLGNMPTFKSYKEPSKLPEILGTRGGKEISFGEDVLGREPEDVMGVYSGEVMGRSIEYPIGAEYESGLITPYEMGIKGKLVEYGSLPSTKTLEYYPAEPTKVSSFLNQFTGESKIFKPVSGEITAFPETSALGKYVTPENTFAGKPQVGKSWKEQNLKIGDIWKRWQTPTDISANVGVGDKYLGKNVPSIGELYGGISSTKPARGFNKATTAIGSYLENVDVLKGSIMGGKSKGWDIKTPLEKSSKREFVQIPGTKAFKLKGRTEAEKSQERINYGGIGGIGGTGGSPKTVRTSGGDLFLSGLGSETKFAGVANRAEEYSGMTFRHLAPRTRTRPVEYEEPEYIRKVIPGVTRPESPIEKLKGPVSETETKLKIGILSIPITDQISKTIQSISQTQSIKSIQEQSTSSMQKQSQLQLQSQKQLQDQTSMQKSALKLGSVLGVSSLLGIEEASLGAQSQVQGEKQVQKQDVLSTLITEPIITTIPRVKEIVIPETKITTTTDIKKTIIEIPKIIIPPVWGGLSVGGGGGDHKRRFKKHKQIWEYPFTPAEAAVAEAKLLKAGSNIIFGQKSSLPTFGIAAPKPVIKQQPTQRPIKVPQKPTALRAIPKVSLPKFNVPVQQRPAKAAPRVITSTQRKTPQFSQFKIPSVSIKSTSNTGLKSMSLPSSLPQKKKGKK